MPYLKGRTLLADRQLAREMDCPECGRTGLSLSPFLRGFRYRCVLTCPRCNREMEA